MSESIVSLLFLVGVPAIIVALAVMTRGRGPRRAKATPTDPFREGFATDPDYEYGVNDGPHARKSRVSSWKVTSRRGHPQLSVEAHSFDIPGNVWVITATPAGATDASPAPLLLGRTTLICSQEGVIGLLENAFGREDVQTGDPTLDGLVCLNGSDRDVVRAVVRQPQVTAALQSIFLGDLPGQRCEVDLRGHLTVVMYRTNMSSEEVRRCCEKVRTLFVGLEAAGAVEPMPLAEPTEVGSVSSSSGAPVGFGGSV